MTEVFTCTEDNVAPDEINNAGDLGLLQVNSCIGWLDITPEEFDGVRNNVEYRIKENN